jgi:HD superfamily phosphodiesterase
VSRAQELFSVPMDRLADLVVALAVGIGGYAVLRGGLATPVRQDTVGIALAFAIVIALGEYYRFHIEGTREQAPMSMAASFAFAMTAICGPWSLLGYGAPTVLGVTALAMVLGATPHLIRGRAVRADGVAARFLGVATTAVLFREWAVSDGQTLLELESLWVNRQWLLACSMLLVSSVGLFVHLICGAIVTAARERRALLPAFLDEARAGAGLGLALNATGVLIALAERPLGIVALPLFLLPLILVQFALRQYASIRETYVQTVRTLSRVTESAGLTRPGHSDRVAELCVAMGRDLGLSAWDTRNLEYAALLHDIGQMALRAPIPAGATVMAAPADQRRIADHGASIVRKTGIPAEVAEAVANQATPYRVVRERGEDLSLFSRIIKVANAYDDFVAGSISPRTRSAAIERIHLGLGYEYDPRVVDSLVSVLARSGAPAPSWR